MSNYLTKVLAYQQDGRASLLSLKVGNSNSKKITETGLSFIINSYASPLKPSVLDVYRLYTDYAVQQGWKKISLERVRQLITSTDVVAISQSRHGDNVTRNQYERTIKRQRPSFADALWTLDGFTIQLRYQTNGKILSDLYCIGIMDVYSNKLIGYAVGTAETSVLVQQALRAAIRNTMMKPLQLQYDNSAANKSAEATELFERMARWAFPTAPYNGKSKPIERLIGHLEGHNMRHMPNFKGGNITSHSLNIKANPDFLSGQELPNMAQAIEQFTLVVEIHNHTTGKDGLTPTERYNVAHPLRKQMDYLEMVQAFWVERKHPARYTKDGLTIEVAKERYTYEVETERGVEDLAWRNEWIGTQFTIKYDPDDLEYISLWKDGVHITEARQKWLAPMAIVDMEDGDRAIIDKALAQRKAQVALNRETIDRHKSNVSDEGLPTELSHGLLHKDAYNRREGRLIDEDISAKTMAIVGYQSRRSEKRVSLYGDGEGSMQVLED
jgi:hypothetical protein